MASLSLSKSPSKKSKRAVDDPGSEAVASSGRSTREYRAIKKHYSSIVDNLGKTVDPAHFARKLWEKSLISETIMEAASVELLAPPKRIAPVIDAVRAQIELKADVFHVFMSILETENSCLAGTLSESYASSPELVLEQRGSDAEVLKIREQDVSDDEPLAASSEGLASSPAGPAPVCPTRHDEASEGLVNVVEEVDKLECRFSNLTCRLQTEMVENETPVIELQHSIAHLPIRMRKEHSKFIKESVIDLSSAKSIKELFMYLNMYWNFFDYALLEHCIERHGSEELKEELKKYVEDLKVFRENTTVEQLLKVCRNGFRSEEPPPDFSKVITKLDRKASEYTLEQLEQFRCQFCCQFSLPTFAVMLVSYEHGSITIRWHIPSSMMDCFHNTTIRWNSISTALIQFEADGLVLQFASDFNAQALEKHTAITHLYLDSQEIGADEMVLLASSLRDKSLLQHLDLSGNNFGLKGVEHLANQILKKNSILAHLDLSGCDIDADGIALLSSSLGNKLCLQYLDLSGNKIDLKAANCLAQALAKNTALTHLDLSWCDIGADEIALLISLLKNKSHIQHLDLRGNRFGSKKAEYLFIGTFQQDEELTQFLSYLLSSRSSETDGAPPPGRSSDLPREEQEESVIPPEGQPANVQSIDGESQQERQDQELTTPSRRSPHRHMSEFQAERKDQELTKPSRRSPRKHMHYKGKNCIFVGGAYVGLLILLAGIIVSITFLALPPDTISMQVTTLIYEEEAVLITQLNLTVQSVNISEVVSDSTDAHIISLYSVNCDLLNYTSESITDTLDANYSGGDIVPLQEFSYYASGSLVNLSIFISCHPMPCSELSSVSFVFFMDYNEHLSFQDGSPLESLDYYTVEQTQLLSQPSLVSVLINSTEYYFIDLVLPKEDSLTYAVSLNITGTRSYLNATTYEKYLFCTLSPSNTSCTFERPPDDNIYCILAYVLGQPPSSVTDRFANVTSVSNNIFGNPRADNITFCVLLAFFILLAAILFTCCFGYIVQTSQ